MITSTTSGWFNLFLKENFNILRTARPEHIIKKIEELKSLKDLEVVDTKDFLDNFKK
jgi:hypothetical protein